MQAFRGILEFWNEAGLLVSGCMCIGYFGAKGWLGYLPALGAIALLIGAFVLAWLLAKPLDQQGEEDFYSERPANKAVDKFLIYLALFVCGIAISVFFGSVL